MQQAQHRNKKYHKLTLSGLQLPQIAPYKSQQQNLCSPHASPSPKPIQQAISNTSSSSQEQAYYQNHLMTHLDILIRELVGQEICYEVLELRESQQSGEGETFDAVVKISLGEGEYKQVMDRIKIWKMQKGNQSKTTKIKKKQRSPKKYQQSSRNLKSNGQKNNLNEDDDNLNTSSTNVMKNGNAKNRQKREYLEQEEDSEDEEDEEGDQRLSKKNTKGLNSTNLRYCIVFSGIIVFALAAIIFLLTIPKSPMPTSPQQPQIPNTPNPQQQIPQFHKSNYPYQGQLIESAKKKIFPIPPEDLDQTTKMEVYYHTLPPVSTVEESLLPFNITYLRPTRAYVFSFPLSMTNTERGDLERKLDFVGDEEEVKKYLDGFGATYEQRTMGLYKQLHRQGPNASPLLLQSQLSHVSPTPPSPQKPLCLLTHKKNSYKKEAYFPFFQSLLSQNYTKYRLIYIEDGPTDKYQSIRIMNSLKKQLPDLIPDGKIYFVQMEKSVGKLMANMAVVREMCGVGDVVVELDGVLVGRQALRLVGRGVDGGFYRNAHFPKNMVKYYPYFTSIPPQSNLKIQKIQIPPNKIITKTQTPPQQQKQQKPNSQKKGPNLQDSIFVARPIQKIWTLFSNQLSSPPTTPTPTIINTKQEQQKYNKIEQSLKNSQSPISILQDLEISINMDSTHCLKAYVMPLQTMLGTWAIDQEEFGTQGGYDLLVYFPMLQLAGRFLDHSKTRDERHFVHLVEPLCFREVRESKCERKMRVYEEINAILNKKSFEPLSHLFQDPPRQIPTSFKNKQQIHQYLHKLQSQITQQCKNQ